MVHLHTRSWYSFLAGASSPRELVAAAVEDGQAALALTDVQTLAGAVQFAGACRDAGIKPIYGAELQVDGYPLVVLCADREGYGNLCDLLTLAHADRLAPRLEWEQLEGRTAGLICLTGDRYGQLATAVRQRECSVVHEHLNRLRRLFPQRLFIEVTHHQRRGDDALRGALAELAGTYGIWQVATNAVRHATPEGYALYDALTCARLRLNVGDPHPERPVNDQAYLRSAAEMQALGFAKAALANTRAIAALCEVELLPEGVTPPQAHLPEGTTAACYLQEICRQALGVKYPAHSRWRRQAVTTLQRELSVIRELGLEEFFLVVREVVQFAHTCGIRCAGRGSAANSVVAYLLGITGVDPIAHHLLFERFLHSGRRGMPDIDVDFAPHRRAEVIAWMERRFGAAHTAMTANVITFRLRLAVREMAKVLGYPRPLINRVAKILPHGSVRHVRTHAADMTAILGQSPLLEALLCLVEALHDCPRHLSLHNGGMILSRAPLRTLSPVQTSANGVRQIQFNKDDVEALGLIKFDVLGLRTLSVVCEALELLQIESNSVPAGGAAPESGAVPDIDALPLDDKPTFELIRAGHTMSVFQIESPGQWNLISRSQPQVFDDLIAQIALFRPGPLQGNMVHPYVLRRRGLQAVEYPHESLREVLADTYGIILYQEQVLQVAHVFAGLSLEEADEFRRLMSKFRSAEEMEGMRARFVQGAIARHGVAPATANQVFDRVAKFVGYGFCRSHAASFAQVVYQTAYLKAHHPAAYMAAVLEHKPGFYPMQTVLEEARHCGVTVLPVDILRSDVKYRLEQGAIRVPLTQVKQVSAAQAATIVLERATRPFSDLEDLYRRVPMHRDAWEGLARAGACAVWGERRAVLWQLGLLARRLGASGQEQLALAAEVFPREAMPPLRRLQVAEATAWDLATQGITTGPHPVALHRPYLDRLGATPIRKLLSQRVGRRVRTAGVVISWQRPPTAKGMAFLVLEDESGRIPTAVTPPTYEQHHQTLREPGLVVEGRLEGAGPGQVGHYRSVLIQRVWPLSHLVQGRDAASHEHRTNHDGGDSVN